MHQADQKRKEQDLLAQSADQRGESEDSTEEWSESEWMEDPSQNSREVADLVASLKRASQTDTMMNDSARKNMAA